MRLLGLWRLLGLLHIAGPYYPKLVISKATLENKKNAYRTSITPSRGSVDVPSMLGEGRLLLDGQCGDLPVWRKCERLPA